MAGGIKDKVAIIGMGCTRFGERWESSAEDLMVEAFSEALADAGVERERIDAIWVGNALDDINVGNSSLPPSVTSPLTTTLDLFNNGDLSGCPEHCDGTTSKPGLAKDPAEVDSWGLLKGLFR